MLDVARGARRPGAFEVVLGLLTAELPADVCGCGLGCGFCCAKTNGRIVSVSATSASKTSENILFTIKSPESKRCRADFPSPETGRRELRTARTILTKAGGAEQGPAWLLLSC